MNRILILGGGFGGLAAAHTFKQLRPQDEVIVVDQGAHFMVGFRKTWGLLGMAPLQDGQRPLADLAKYGIQVIRDAVTAIEPQAQAAEVNGRRLEADAMVVALGAQLAPEQVPGFSNYAINVYDSQAIPQAAEALQAFAGGRVVVGIFSPLYKCPPAPYEIALLTREYFRDRGVDANLEVFTPQPMSLPILGDAGCNVIESRLAENGITFLPNHKAAAVEKDEVVFNNGSSRPYDLLLGIPPHRCPEVVVKSGLADKGGWVRVDRDTLETRFAGVYAIGDVTEIMMANGKPLPKAGVFAEAEGKVVAHQMAAGFEGRKSDVVFDGKGGCFLEVGRGEATMVAGEFLAQPAPQVQLTEASVSYLEQKRAFEKERLKEWFG